MTDHEKNIETGSNGISKDSGLKENSRKGFGNDPHHPDHLRNRNKDEVKELKGGKGLEDQKKNLVTDPHDPDHPRNRLKRDATEEIARDSSKDRNKHFGSDPHHPDHPRNRTM